MNAFESSPPLFAFNLSSLRPEPFVFEEKKRKNQILIKNVIAKRRKMKTKQWTQTCSIIVLPKSSLAIWNYNKKNPFKEYYMDQ